LRRIHRRHPAGAVERVRRSVAGQRHGGDRLQPLPLGMLAGAEPARQAAGILALQRQAGNRAVAQLITQARPSAARAAGGGISVHGETSGHYDGGSSKVVNSRIRRAANCRDCPPEQGCVRATGTLVVDYHVDVTIRMPDMPGGLTACQQRRVRTFLRDVLRPHENEHARRLRTYNGTTRRRFDLAACGREAVQERVQEMHTTEADARAARADALSAAIDPFVREINLDCR
jgi:hypothetical protein